MQSIIYSALMIPVGFLPYFTGITGKGTSGIICMAVLFICNLWMVYVSVLLFRNMNAISARRVMFSSYFYLMVVLLALFMARA